MRVRFSLSGTVTGEMLLFFSLHGLLTASEAYLQSRLAAIAPKTRIPAVLSVPVTLTVVMVTAHRLFFQPLGKGRVFEQMTSQLLRAAGL